ncbi:2-hydroxymuconic semialdehyde hydrolase [Limosilactobacillus ingluviei]
MTPLSKDIIIVDAKKDIDNIDGLEYFYSQFPTNRNIGINELKALMSGKALVDVSDGEYIHWLQLDQNALKFSKDILNKW